MSEVNRYGDLKGYIVKWAMTISSRINGALDGLSARPIMIGYKMKKQLVSITGYGLILFGCLSLIFEVWNALTLRMHFRAQGMPTEEVVNAKTILYILYISSAFPVFLCTVGLYILKERWENWIQRIITAGLILSSIWLLIVSFQTC